MTRRGGRALLVASLLAVAILPSCGDDKDSLTGGSLSLTCAASPASGTAPLQVAFTAVPSGMAGTLSVVVSFGDGTTAAGTTAGHTYTTPGSYTARFTAVASGGSSAECSTGVTVLAPAAGPVLTGNQPPDAVFKTTPGAVADTISGRAPLDVTFNMCPTVDPDHDRLLFTMDADLDGSLEVRGTTGADCRRTFTYSLGTTRARVCVTDVDGGLEAIHPPECTIYRIDATP
jgi:PKD domain